MDKPNIIERKFEELQKKLDILKKENELQTKRLNHMMGMLFNGIKINYKIEENIYDYLEEKEINEDLSNKIKEDICLICLQNYNIKDKICYLPCNHFFHAFCIKKWLEMKHTCPICKKCISCISI